MANQAHAPTQLMLIITHAAPLRKVDQAADAKYSITFAGGGGGGGAGKLFKEPMIEFFK